MMDQYLLFYLLCLCLGLSSCQQGQSAQNPEGFEGAKKSVAKANPKVKDSLGAQEINLESLKKDSSLHLIDSLIQTLMNLENQFYNLKPLVEAMQRGDSIDIVCFGNSITYGFAVNALGQVAEPYPEVLEKLLQKRFANDQIHVINQGHNGWRSDQGLAAIQELVLAKQPHLVLVMFGINDAYSNFSLALYENKMRAIVQKLKENNIKVLTLTPTPILTSFQSKVASYCETLKKISEEEEVAFLNLQEIILKRAKEEQLALQALLPDDVHFANPNYRWIAEAIDQFIGEIK